ncbi:MAG: hypothetical protein ABIV48_12025 [Pyrinomonadaceae bacterium]
MKRCPECRKDYLDDSLLYCLDDGTALVQGSVTDEPATALMSAPDLVTENLDTAARREVRPDRRLRLWQLAAGVLLLGCLISVALALWTRNSRTTDGNDPRKTSLVPLTNDPGYEGEATFSPDGETIAYVSDRTGNFEIYIQQVSGGAYRNITENPSDDVQPSHSPDGKEIAFVSTRSSSSTLRGEGYDLPLLGGDIWVMSALGGNARRLARDGNFPSWSRDGSAVLYTSGTAFNQKIYRISAQGDTPQEIVPKLDPAGGRARFLLYPSYSGDDKYILFEADSPSGFGPRDVWVMNVGDGAVQHVAKGMCPKWNANSTAIIYSSAESGKNFSLWQRPFPISNEAPPVPLTISRGRDVHAVISRDGQKIAFTGLELASNVETLDFDDTAGKPTGSPVPVTSGRQISYFQSLSPDGQTAVFESRIGFDSRLWKVRRGETPSQITSDPNYNDTYPRWSPDGQNIAFTRKAIKDTASASAVWVMAADGAGLRPLAEKAGNTAWTGDSTAIVYFSYVDRQLYRFDLATGASNRITNEPEIVPVFVVTADSRLVVFQSLEGGNTDLKLISIEGGESRRVVATPRQDYHPFFSPTGKWLYFQPDHKNLYRVPGPAQNWRSAEPEKITDYSESGLFMDDPQLSADGRRLIYTHGRQTGDIWLLRFEHAN